MTVREITKNQGGSAAGGSTTKFYLSINATLDTGDVLLGSRTMSALAATASSTGTTTFMIPPATVAGRYTLLAVTDANNVVTESIENNNLKWAVLTVP